MGDVYELRCRVRYDGRGDRNSKDGSALAIDAELLHEENGVLVDTQVLAVGEMAWASSADDEAFDSEAWRWLMGEQFDWPSDPRHLPHDGARHQWAKKIANLLRTAIAPSLLDELFIDHAADPDTAVRVVFHAQDEFAARLPYETLAWRLERGGPIEPAASLVSDDRRRISMLRIADRVRWTTAPRLGALRPGSHVVRVCTSSGASEDVEPLWKAIVRLGPAEPIPVSESGKLKSALESADLAILAGHGEGPKGLLVSGGARIVGTQIAAAMPPGCAAILAMCGSAQSTTGDDRGAPALDVARRGASVTIGFQGDRASMAHVPGFLTALVDHLAPILAEERRDRPVRLADWERAIGVARRTISAGGVAPVVYVHPGLLTGHRTGRHRRLEQQSDRPKFVRSGRGRTGRKVTTVAWHVPGQLGIIADSATDIVMRVPLQVDVGVRVHVEARAGSGESKLTGAHEMLARDLADVLACWPSQEPEHLEVTVTPGIWAAEKRNWVVKTWAARCAQLSAAIRALSVLRGRPVPTDALQVLDRVVHKDWGAHDGSLSFVSCRDGRWIRSAGVMPPLLVSTVDVMWRPGALPETLYERIVAAAPRGTLHDAVGQLSDAASIAKLIAAQRDTLQRLELPRNLVRALDRPSGGLLIALPSVAEVSWRTGDDARCGVPGVEPAVYSPGSDELFVETIST